MTKQKYIFLFVSLFVVFAVAGIGFWKIKTRAPISAPSAKGDLSPQVEMRTIDGRSLTFPNGEATYSLVVFWASWCAPCAQETPSLARLATRNPGWNFLLVSADSTLKEIKEFLKIFPNLHQPNIQIIWDKDRSLSSQFGTSGLPESFLFGQDGRLIEKFVGSMDWDALKISDSKSER